MYKRQVLNDKLSYANQHAVKFDMRISGEVASVNAMRVAILLSNLLDNAFEASERGEEPRVELDMYERKGMYYIQVANSVDGAVLEKNPFLHTTKKNADKHGIGLKSIRQITRELDGSLQMYEEKGMFYSSISFPV